MGHSYWSLVGAPADTFADSWETVCWYIPVCTAQIEFCVWSKKSHPLTARTCSLQVGNQTQMGSSPGKFFNFPSTAAKDCTGGTLVMHLWHHKRMKNTIILLQHLTLQKSLWLNLALGLMWHGTGGFAENLCGGGVGWGLVGSKSSRWHINSCLMSSPNVCQALWSTLWWSAWCNSVCLVSVVFWRWTEETWLWEAFKQFCPRSNFC